MSHRLLDEIADLEGQLVDLDAEIAAVRAARVVDFPVLAELRRKRAALIARLADNEKTAS